MFTPMACFKEERKMYKFFEPKRLLIFTLVFSVGTNVFAKNLSLEQATILALKKSENIEQYALDIEMAKEQIEEAYAILYPQVSAEIQGIRHTKAPVLQFNGTSVPVRQDWELLSSLTLNQIVYSFGRVGSALKIAKLSNKVQIKAKQIAEREIRQAVEVAYYNAILAKSILDISEDSLSNARKNQKALQKRFQGGRVPRLDNLRMESEIAARKPSVSNATKNLKLAYLQLNLLTGLPINTNPVLTSHLGSSFKKLSESQLISKAKEAPQVELAQLSVDLASKQMEIEESYHYPTISAFGNASHSGTGDEMPPRDENLFTSVSVGLAINIPIYEGGAVVSRTRQKAIEKRRAEVAKQRVIEQTDVELLSNVQEYNTGLERLSAAKEAVRLSKQAYELTRTRYETGGVTRNDLNDSERSLTAARIEVESIKFGLLQNKSIIKRITEEVE